MNTVILNTPTFIISNICLPLFFCVLKRVIWARYCSVAHCLIYCLLHLLYNQSITLTVCINIVSNKARLISTSTNNAFWCKASWKQKHIQAHTYLKSVLSDTSLWQVTSDEPQKKEIYQFISPVVKVCLLNLVFLSWKQFSRQDP